MPKEPKVMSVVTIPLKTRVYQEDILARRLEMCRTVYNNMLAQKIKDYTKVIHSPEYVAMKKIIDDVYRISDEREKRNAKSSEEYKRAVSVSREILIKNGISEFGFTGDVKKFTEPYKAHIPSTVAALSIAKPLWGAFSTCIYGKGEKVRFKKMDSFSSMLSDGRSGIRLINDLGETIQKRTGSEPLFCVFGSNRGGKVLTMPLEIDEDDTFVTEMLKKQIRQVRIIRTFFRQKYRYSVQLVVEGAAAEKVVVDTGEIKNPVLPGKVGIYLDSESITVVSARGEVLTEDFSGDDPKDVARLASLSRHLDRSKRKSNPENFNPDGTIKKGIVADDGKRHRLKWTFSKSYYETKNKLRDLHRRMAETRKIRNGTLCNKITLLGNEMLINDYSFSKVKSKQTVVKENGDEEKRRSKKATTIQANAPSEIYQILERKLVAAGGFIEKKKRDDSYSGPDYRMHNAVLFSEMLKDS